MRKTPLTRRSVWLGIVVIFAVQAAVVSSATFARKPPDGPRAPAAKLTPASDGLSALPASPAGVTGTLRSSPRTAQETQLPSKHVLTLEAAKRVADAAEAEAARNGWAVAIAVLDDSGQLLLFRRMDGAKLVAIDIAIRKARTAAYFQGPTVDLEAEVAGGRTALLPIDEFMPLQGGVPLMYDNQLVGAVAASGVTGAQDEQCALAGAAALQD